MTTWVLKCTENAGHAGLYVTEHALGETYFHKKQRHAKRFRSLGRAYRAAMKIGDCKVVKLRPACACTQGYCCDRCWKRSAEQDPCPAPGCANPKGHTGKHGAFDNTGAVQITAAEILNALAESEPS